MPHQHESDCGLLGAERRLRIIEQLLLHPTPNAIQDANLLVEQAFLLIQHFTKEKSDTPDAVEVRRQVSQFQARCLRISKLLEGALRIHWSRMKFIGSFTETYTAGAKKKIWKPRHGTLNVQM